MEHDVIRLWARVPESHRVDGLEYGAHVSRPYEGWSGYYVRPEGTWRWGIARLTPASDDLPGQGTDCEIVEAIATEILDACEDTPIPDGEYYVFSDGGGWSYREYVGGRLCGGAEECEMGSHVAAGDRYATLDPERATEDVELEVVWAILGPELNADLVTVLRVPD